MNTSGSTCSIAHTRYWAIGLDRSKSVASYIDAPQAFTRTARSRSSYLLPATERSALRTRACLDAKSNPHVATAAELLFALEEPCFAEQLTVDRASELDGRNYVLLTSLVETARANGRWLAATMIWRALLDAILTRGYAKGYGHAARYLRELRGTASQIEDFHGHPTHADYEGSLRIAHGRKTSFWQRLSDG
jgi:hypothetical protein